MKIKLSRSQWEGIGKKAGWMKKAVINDDGMADGGTPYTDEEMDLMEEPANNDNSLRAKSQKWWGSLSINEMKELTRKHHPNPHVTWSFINQTPSLVEDIYMKEII